MARRNVYKTGTLSERISIRAIRAAENGNDREAANLYEQVASMSPEGKIRNHYMEAAAAHHFWADQRDNGNYPGNSPRGGEQETLKAAHYHAISKRINGAA